MLFSLYHPIRCNANPSAALQLTIWIRSFTQCQEIDYGVVHLQDSGAFSMHHSQTGSPPHCIVRQASRQDHEWIPGIRENRHLTAPFNMFHFVTRSYKFQSALNGRKVRSNFYCCAVSGDSLPPFQNHLRWEEPNFN